jgi:hypothetical protein
MRRGAARRVRAPVEFRTVAGALRREGTPRCMPRRAIAPREPRGRRGTTDQPRDRRIEHGEQLEGGPGSCDGFGHVAVVGVFETDPCRSGGWRTGSMTADAIHPHDAGLS